MVAGGRAVVSAAAGTLVACVGVTLLLQVSLLPRDDAGTARQLLVRVRDGVHTAAGTGSGSSESGPPSKRWRQPHQPQPLARLFRPPTSWTGAATQSDPHPDSPPPHVNTDQRQARIVRSSLSCRRMDAWGDVCVYRDVCFPLGAQEPNRPDGGMRFFWGPEGNTAGYRAPFPLGDVQTGYVAPRTERLVPRLPDMSGEYDWVAFNSAVTMVHVSAADLEAQGVAMTWLPDDTSLWITGHHVPVANLWYFSSRMLPLYRALKLNSTGTLGMHLPPLSSQDYLYMPLPEEHVRVPWLELLDRTVMATTGTSSPRRVYADSPFVTQWNLTNLVCFKHAVATGAAGYVLPDMETGFALREDLYDALGISAPTRPVARVLLYLRQSPTGYGPRHILNLEEVLDAVRSTGVPFTLSRSHPPDVKEQAEMFASHGVVIQPHGAGETNIVFMAPGSAAVELFPFHFDHTLYSGMAALMGVGMYPAHATNGSLVYATDKLYMQDNCDEWSPLSVNDHRPCRQHGIELPFVVDIPSFRAALTGALLHIERPQPPLASPRGVA